MSAVTDFFKKVFSWLWSDVLQRPVLFVWKFLRSIALRRRAQRAALVFGILCLLAARRIDRAVSTAYEADWVRPGQAGTHCSRCDRLPDEVWLIAWPLVGLLGLVLLSAAVWFWWRRLFAPGSRRRESDRRSTARACIVLSALVFVLGVVVLHLRQLAGNGYGEAYLTAAQGTEFLAFFLIAIMFVVVGDTALSRGRAGSGVTLLKRGRHFLQLHRISLLVVILLTLVLAVVSQTSGQAIDSVHTWGLGNAASASRLTFGLAATLLLALMLYEGGIQLTQTELGMDLVPRSFWIWLAALTAIGGGVVLGFAGSPGLFVLSGTALVLLGMDLFWRKPTPTTRSALSVYDPADDTATEEGAAKAKKQAAKPESPSARRARAAARKEAEHSPEYLAMVPLVAMAAVAAAAFIDGALTGAVELTPFFVALGLGVAAVSFTREKEQARLDSATWWIWLLAGVLIPAAGTAVIVFHNGTAAAIAGGVALVALVGYSIKVFRQKKQFRPGGDVEQGRIMFAAPLALGTGIAAFAAVRSDVQRVAPVVGTLGLVCIGLAAFMVAGHYAVKLSLRHGPPQPLRAIGIERLPIVTILLIVWIVAGLFPLETHDVRIVSRLEIQQSKGQALDGGYPEPATLSDAFESWWKAQPELGPTDPRGNGEVIPMVLVAAHGGGIRAAYWTALALDCIVAVDPIRPTCGTDDAKVKRRDATDQRRAARRIFLASGVSGGAVGIYEYARQLLLDGELTDAGGDRTWVEDRLDKDFASAAIAWAMFVDFPNHFLGFHRDRAAVLEDSFDRAWEDRGPAPYMRHAWDLRFSDDRAHKAQREKALDVPIVITNATVTGGRTRAIVSPLDLSVWPGMDTTDPARGAIPDEQPLAGSVEIRDALCVSHDLRLSSAAILGARFPYVTPSGRLAGGCDGENGVDRHSRCNRHGVSCTVDVVDGGYADNSGLFTIEELWPSIRALVTRFNRSADAHGYRVAPVIVELDNHYRPPEKAPAGAGGGKGGQTLIPPMTAFGAHGAIETFARANAYRLAPDGCVITISPGLHPGLVAPLGWELSGNARNDLRDGLTATHPTSKSVGLRAETNIHKIQNMLGPPSTYEALARCVPGAPGPAA